MCVLLLSVDRVRYKIQIPLPPKIDPSVTMMQVQRAYCCFCNVADTVGTEVFVELCFFVFVFLCIA